MPEAVIVSAARSPIGRAGKGSLASMRPDDLAAAVVRAALDKVPELDPVLIDDSMPGGGQPAGEADELTRTPCGTPTRTSPSTPSTPSTEF